MRLPYTLLNICSTRVAPEMDISDKTDAAEKSIFSEPLQLGSGVQKDPIRWVGWHVMVLTFEQSTLLLHNHFLERWPILILFCALP